MTRELSRKFHEAKARKRMALPPPEYPPIIDYGKLVKRITMEDFRDGSRHVFELFISKRRRDMWRVVLDGREWKAAIGYSYLMAAIRKSR
jgi:hypothetical protein